MAGLARAANGDLYVLCTLPAELGDAIGLLVVDTLARGQDEAGERVQRAGQTRGAQPAAVGKDD